MRRPEFWDTPKRGWQTYLLSPAAALYGLGRMAHVACVSSGRVPVPMICVGNVTAGGAGKTPVALDLGARLQRRGHVTHFLSRGYGGRLPGPVRVMPNDHAAADVGDEPLLLAEVAPTWVAADRLAGARRAASEGAEVIVMDDGFQNPRLVKDLSLLVFDGAAGLGNGALLPAGPLRETLDGALRRAQAAVLMGEDHHHLIERIGSHLPVFQASVIPNRPAPGNMDRVVAFAGIARPRKFFDTLEAAGYQIADTASFPDHHPYSDTDLADLRTRAARLDAGLITTQKDLVRLSGSDRDGVSTLGVTLKWVDETGLDLFVETGLAEARQDGSSGA